MPAENVKKIQLVKVDRQVGNTYFLSSPTFVEVQEGMAAMGEGISFVTKNLITCSCLYLVAKDVTTNVTAVFLAHLSHVTDYGTLRAAVEKFLENKTLQKVRIVAGEESFPLIIRFNVTSKVNVFMALHCLHEITNRPLRDLYEESYKGTVNRNVMVGVSKDGKLILSRDVSLSRDNSPFDVFMAEFKKEMSVVPLHQRKDSFFDFAIAYFPEFRIQDEEKTERKEIMNARLGELVRFFNIFPKAKIATDVVSTAKAFANS